MGALMNDVGGFTGERRERFLGPVWTSALIVIAMVASYVIFGEMAVDQLRQSPPWLVMLIGVALLAADIFIPVPSTVVVVILAQALGPFPAVIAGTVGVSAGCAVGYALGRLGRSRTLRLVDAARSDQLSRWLCGPGGVNLLAVLRPVPIIGESAVVIAGLVGLKAGDVLIVTSLSNLALVICYVTLAAWAEDWGGFVAAILASWALPAIAVGLYWLLRRSRASGNTE